MTKSDVAGETASVSGSLTVKDALIVELLSPVDLYRISDALLGFLEAELERAGADPLLAMENFVWKEVAADEFEAACIAGPGQGREDTFLCAVWGEGRLAILPRAFRMDEAGWGRLLTQLVASQAGLAPDGPQVHVLQRPVVPTGLAGGFRIAPDLPQADRTRPIRASLEQYNQLAFQRSAPSGHHFCTAMRPILFDRPDMAALQATFEALQERHEILHMAFQDVQGEVYICLSDQCDVPFSVAPDSDPHLTLTQAGIRQTAALASQPFPTDLLWRAQLLLRGAQGVLCCVLSEVIADEQTAEMLRDELIRFYGAYHAGENPEQRWPAPQFHYTDYAAAQPDQQHGARPEQGPHHSDTRHAARRETRSRAPVVSVLREMEPELHASALRAAGVLGVSVKSLMLTALISSFKGLDAPRPGWVLVAAESLRPAGLPELLGPFSWDYPLWLDEPGFNHLPQEVHRRIGALRSAPAKLATATHALQPLLDTPTHFCRFTYKNTQRLFGPKITRAIMELSVIDSGPNLTLICDISEEHPCADRPDIFADTLILHINELSKTDCFNMER